MPKAMQVLAVGVLGVLAAILWTVVATLPDDRLRLVFLDVGEGNAVLILTPGNQRLLIGGGPSPSVLISQVDRQLPFWDRHLDLMILPRPGDDHLLSLIALAERLPVAAAIEPAYMPATESASRWRTTLATKGVVPQSAMIGDGWALAGGGRLEIIYAGPADRNSREGDAWGIGLRVRQGNVSILLAGDLGVEGQQWLLSQGGNLASTVLQIPRQGRKNGLEPAFATAVAPTVAIVNVGRDNRFGHPAAETLALLPSARIYRSDHDGTVVLETDGRGWGIRTKQ